MTRAKDRLFLTHASRRATWGPAGRAVRPVALPPRDPAGARWQGPRSRGRRETDDRLPTVDLDLVCRRPGATAGSAPPSGRWRGALPRLGERPPGRAGARAQPLPAER